MGRQTVAEANASAASSVHAHLAETTNEQEKRISRKNSDVNNVQSGKNRITRKQRRVSIFYCVSLRHTRIISDHSTEAFIYADDLTILFSASSFILSANTTYFLTDPHQMNVYRFSHNELSKLEEREINFPLLFFLVSFSPTLFSLDLT